LRGSVRSSISTSAGGYAFRCSATPSAADFASGTFP
jgi:hypothetical protein